MADPRDVNSSTYATLPPPMQWQANDVAEELRKIGAYDGSPTDALTDAVGIVLALVYAPLGDNHHNAAACPHCGDLLGKMRAERDLYRDLAANYDPGAVAACESDFDNKGNRP